MSARITDRVFEPDDDASGQNEVAYLLKDLYAVAGLADERGWPVERYDYDAYGKVYMNRCAVLPWAADFDGDGDVDQNDLTVLLDAYGGSGEVPNGPCGWRADLDGDGDVDGSDYVLFADAYNGAGNPPRSPSPTVSVGSTGLTTGPMVTSRVGNPFFFTGRRLDVMDKQTAGTPHHFTDDYAGLELYDYRARTMDPVVGRFNQQDPNGYLDGIDLYEYCGDDPTSRTDPTGLFSVGDLADAILSYGTGLLGARQSFRACTRVAALGCVCIIVGAEDEVRQCCQHGKLKACNIFYFSVSIGVYSCESLGGWGFITPPFPAFATAFSPALKRPGSAIAGAGNTACPREGWDGSVCATASVGFSSSTVGARACYNFRAGTLTTSAGFGIGTGTGVAGGGAATYTSCW